MIEKKDPFRFFKIEAQELLEKLSQGLLELEKIPTDESLLNELFRHAHTLKGSARLVQLKNIGDIAHLMEDLLGVAKKGEKTITSAHIDIFLKSLDVVENILKLLTEGEDPHIDVSETLEILSAGTASFFQEQDAGVSHPKKTLTSESGDSQPSTETTIPQKTKTPLQPATLPTELAGPPPEKRISPPVPDNSSDGGIKGTDASEPLLKALRPSTEEDDTIRISLQKLNNIMNYSGELMINKIKLQNKVNQLNEISTLTTLNESLTNEWYQHRDTPEMQTLLKETPFVQEAILRLEQSFQIQKQIKTLIRDFSDQYKQDLKLTHLISVGLQDEAFKSRMQPAEVLFSTFGRLVRDLSKDLEKEIELVTSGEQIEVDKQVLDNMKAPLMHLIRNAVDHGIESPEEREQLGKPRAATLSLKLEHRGKGLALICEDDGRGIDPERIRNTALQKKIITPQEAEDMDERESLFLVLKPGFSTAEIVSKLSGRGVGLDVVSNAVNQLKGNIIIQSEIGKFTRFMIEFPQSLANLPCLLLSCAGEKMLLPLSSISKILRITRDEVATEGNQEVINVYGRATPLVRLSQVLKLSEGDFKHNTKLPVVVLCSREEYMAFAIDRLLGIQEIIVKDLGNHIQKVANIGGATILGDGNPVIILDPAELIQASKGSVYQGLKQTQVEQEEEESFPLLVVDDSLTTRMMEKAILESAGYRVDLAVSAEEALEKIKQNKYSLFIIDVEMPGMNGFELTKSLKKMDDFSETPIVIVSSLASSEMKRKGIEAGAQAYIVKGEFDQNTLLETIASLI